MKTELKKAFDAGMQAEKHNQGREKLLDKGTKQCPAEITFESWYESQNENQKTGNVIKYDQWPGYPMGEIG